MDRNEFVEFLEQQLDGVKSLFAAKNVSYGIEDDVFHNFRSTALRVFGMDDHETMFRAIMTYMDKHLVALANKGIKELEFQSRLQDIIVYSFLAMALKEDEKTV